MSSAATAKPKVVPTELAAFVPVFQSKLNVAPALDRVNLPVVFEYAQDMTLFSAAAAEAAVHFAAISLAQNYR